MKQRQLQHLWLRMIVECELEIHNTVHLLSIYLRINGITFLAAVILLGEANQRNENARLEALFSLVDFNNCGQISADELVSPLYLIRFMR